MSNKLQAKDLINLGLFTVLYFVIGCCVAIPVGFVPIFLPILGALWSLITGIPFMLFLTRVKKFGMVTIMGILSGLLMGLTCKSDIILALLMFEISSFPELIPLHAITVMSLLFGQLMSIARRDKIVDLFTLICSKKSLF